jgi:hypothetical protein
MRFIEVTLFASVALAHAQGGLPRVARRHYGADSSVVSTSTQYHTATVYETRPSDGPGKSCKKKHSEDVSGVGTYVLLKEKESQN